MFFFISIYALLSKGEVTIFRYRPSSFLRFHWSRRSWGQPSWPNKLDQQRVYYKAKNSSLSCGTNVGNPERARVGNQSTLLIMQAAFTAFAFATCRVWKQLKQLGDIFYFQLSLASLLLFSRACVAARLGINVFFFLFSPQKRGRGGGGVMVPGVPSGGRANRW